MVIVLLLFAEIVFVFMMLFVMLIMSLFIVMFMFIMLIVFILVSLFITLLRVMMLSVLCIMFSIVIPIEMRRGVFLILLVMLRRILLLFVRLDRRVRRLLLLVVVVKLLSVFELGCAIASDRKRFVRRRIVLPGIFELGKVWRLRENVAHVGVNGVLGNGGYVGRGGK